LESSTIISPSKPQTTQTPVFSSNNPIIAQISSTALFQFAKRDKAQIYKVSIQEIKDHLASKENKKSPKEEEKFLQSKIPAQFHNLLPLFRKKDAKRLPPHRGPLDCPIDLKEGKSAPFGPLYPMSDLELQALQAYLNNNLQKGYIKPSSSSAASPVLFIKKPREGLRFYINYRALNAITKHNKTPLPLIDNSLQRLSRAKIFSQLDLR
jgi:hypothetical protein